MNYTREKFIKSLALSGFGLGLLTPVRLISEGNEFSLKRRNPIDYRNQQISDFNFPRKDSLYQFGSLADSNINYIGRWDKSDPEVFKSYWGGAYLRTMFTGKSVSIKLAAEAELVVSLDNEAARGVSGVQGLTELTNGRIKEGTHSLLVGSAGQNTELLFQGLILDAEETTQQPKKYPVIEFVGDSITTGTGPSRVSTANWAWNSAVALGCDHTQIAFSGIALTSGFGCLRDKTGMDSQYFRLKNFNHPDDNPQIDWDFAYTPDIIVVNLGQNDQCGKEPDNVFAKSVLSFAEKLRAKFITTKIAVMRPFGGPYAASIESAVSSLNAGGDQRVHYIDTSGWLSEEDYSDGVHPNGTGNIKVVTQLVPVLRPLLVPSLNTYLIRS